MKNYSQWQDAEIKSLFNVVEKYKNENKSLLSAFSEYSKKSGRKRNSIRNYYYLELAELQNNPKRAKFLNIDVSLHSINSSVFFTDNETRDIIKQILKLNSMGISIRKACLQLANNDINNMVRYQNKYRSVLKSNPKLIEELTNELKLEGYELKNKTSNIKKETPDNVIYLKKQEPKTISEKDINSLFLGLIKLVKRTAAESIEKNLISELDFANSTLRKTLVKLSKTEQDYKELQKNYDSQKIECEKLKLENAYLRSEIANMLNPKTKSQSKQRTLSSFLYEMKQKKQAN